MTDRATAPREPIAIVGIGCRFPGGVDSPESFWRLLRDGVDAITEIPPDRFDVEALYDPRPATPGKIAMREGGFLRERLDQFDAAFFGISPREAAVVDPQQRLLLELTWEAFEDAGLTREALAGSRTGVFVGMWTNEYEGRMYAAVPDIDLYVTTGGGRYSSSGRLSYAFDLQGPSLTVDTACSSSLVAVHLAVQSLRTGESTMAVAGGVNLILEPHISIGYSRSKMLSPEGRCRFGDAQANGYVRSEGAGVLVLKPLAQAQADGDPIYALILGSAVNNDGHSSGLLVAPSGQGQEAMLREAYRQAGIKPGRVRYMEAHGTGTRVGDPTELAALGAVLAEGRGAGERCLVGSVKTNIGHTEAASGVAGLIKATLCLQRRQIPPSLHFRTPNPAVPWDQLPLTLSTALQPWPEESGPAYAGVNSFGITGTNAHIVLQAAPEPPSDGGASPSPTLLPLSASSPEALQAVTQRYREYLSNAPASTLLDFAYTAAVRRTHHEHRLAVVAQSREALIERLADVVQAGQSNQRRPRPPKIAFVFPGQGSQWLGMGRQLLKQEPVFRAAIERCAEAFRPHVDWSLVEQLTVEAAHSRLEEIDVVQPMLFAMQVGLAALWRAWGVEPEAVVGHSMGEVAAAHIAGALSLEDAATIICRRSRLMKHVSGRGAMALVELSLAEARDAVSGYKDRLGVAVSNGPRSTVLSGEPEALAAVLEELQARGIFCRPVKVDVAAHSPQMEPLRPELVAALAGLRANPIGVPLYSTVTGQPISAEALNAGYWGRNLREPVLFADAVERLLADGFDTFIEISPHPVLLPAIERSTHAGAEPVLTVASLRRDEPECAALLAGLGALYIAGYAVDWRRLYPVGRVLRLPTYPWQRERFWYEDARATTPRAARRAGLLGEHWESSIEPGSHFWETELSTDAFPYLADHQVRGRSLLPAAALVELGLAAAHSIWGDSPHQLEDLHLREALPLDDPRRVQVVAAPEPASDNGASTRFGIRILSRPISADANWTLHATAQLRIGVAPAARRESLESIRGRCRRIESAAEHYAAMSARGLDYGPAFRGANELQRGEGEVLAQLRLPAQAPTNGYRLHPALLDAALQLLVATDSDRPHAALLPVRVERLSVWATPATEAWGYARRTETANGLTGDVLILNAEGEVLVEAAGVQLEYVESTRPFRLAENVYEVRWEKIEIDAREMGASDWLIFSDRRGLGDALRETLTARGGRCVCVSRSEYDASRPSNFQRVLQEAFPTGCANVAGLWGLDEGADLTSDALSGSTALLHLAQTLATLNWPQPPRLWLVTAGAQAVSDGESVNAAQAALWGLGGTLAHEHPEWRSTCIDLETPSNDAPSLVKLLAAAPREDRLAIRGGAYFAARLVPASLAAEAARISAPEAAVEIPFQAQTAQPGILDELRWRPLTRRAPGLGEVEIAVRVTGLNFMNVMSALGIYPGVPKGLGPLGLECAGVIARVGEGVLNLKPGDAVLAVAHDCLGTHAIADARLVARKPEALSFEQAATLPIVFLTAHYALNHLAQLQPGERVLIHAATGGVGLAAIQFARRVGAEIYATAGSDEKRAYLKSLGVQHVFDSRTLAFGDEVMAATDGAGVDVVLNSLAGEAIARGLDVLRPYGRFIEIGKRDIYQNSRVGLWPFQKNLSYFAVDLDRMSRERPDRLGALLAEVVAWMAAGELQPLPVRAYPAAQLAEAFRHMAQARHIGKVALAVEDRSSLTIEGAAPGLFREAATYLITGGLGGLGLVIARWMVANGARHLALLSRRGATPEAQPALDELAAQSATVRVLAADVADGAQLQAALGEITHTLPPLRGVIHAAGVLDDGILLQQDAARFRAVMTPKVTGAWNLHTLTAEMPLDFFVLFSSIASLFGTAGQGNYAAANAFMDGLAHARRAEGRPALSIQWGPFAEVGLAAQHGRSNQLARRGLNSLTPEQGLDALAQLLPSAHTQIAVMTFDARQWLAAYPADGQTSLLNGWSVATPIEADDPTRAAKDDHSIRAQLLAAEPGRQRRGVMETYLREQAAHVLRLAPAKIEPHKPLRALGFDSLMTLEFRNRLEAGLTLSLPATLVWNYPTVAELAAHLAGKLNLPLDADVAPTPASVAPQPATDGLEALSDSEVDALLSDELAAIDALLKGKL